MTQENGSADEKLVGAVHSKESEEKRQWRTDRIQFLKETEKTVPEMEFIEQPRI